MDQHHLGVGAQVGELGYRCASLAETRRLVGAPDQSRPGAQNRAAGGAAFAMATEDRKAADNPVAGGHVVHQAANGLHRSRRFMPQHHRHGRGVEPLDEMQVAVTDARGPGAHQYFSGAGRRDVNLFDLQWLVYFVQHRCFHVKLLLGDLSADAWVT